MCFCEHLVPIMHGGKSPMLTEKSVEKPLVSSLMLDSSSLPPSLAGVLIKRHKSCRQLSNSASQTLAYTKINQGVCKIQILRPRPQRARLSRSGVRPKNLHFQAALGQCRCCLCVDPTAYDMVVILAHYLMEGSTF